MAATQLDGAIMIISSFKSPLKVVAISRVFRAVPAETETLRKFKCDVAAHTSYYCTRIVRPQNDFIAATWSRRKTEEGGVGPSSNHRRLLAIEAGRWHNYFTSVVTMPVWYRTISQVSSSVIAMDNQFTVKKRLAQKTLKPSWKC